MRQMQRYINGALLFFEFTEIMSDRGYERARGVEKDWNFYADFTDSFVCDFHTKYFSLVCYYCHWIRNVIFCNMYSVHSSDANALFPSHQIMNESNNTSYFLMFVFFSQCVFFAVSLWYLSSKLILILSFFSRICRTLFAYALNILIFI